jgi:hypothetical protein
LKNVFLTTEASCGQPVAQDVFGGKVHATFFWQQSFECRDGQSSQNAFGKPASFSRLFAV